MARLSPSRILGTARLAREAAASARSQARRASSGKPGSWQAELTVSGLDAPRREEIVGALCAATGAEPMAPRGDGLLHAGCVVSGLGFQASFAFLLSRLGQMLRDAGLSYEEIAASRVSLAMTPAPAPAGPAPRRRLLDRAAEKLGAASAGASFAAEDMADRGARQAGGDRTFQVSGDIDGLGDDDSAEMAFHIAAHGGEARPVNGHLNLTVRAECVGTGFGALCLSAGHLGGLLELAGPQASLRISAEPA